jgi:hypothetical protein
MSGDSGAAKSPILRRLLGPSGRIGDGEDRRAAKLLAALLVVHLVATVLGTVAASLFRLHWVKDSPLSGPLGLVLLLCTLLVLLSYILVRAGRYHGGLIFYIAATALFPLSAPFVGQPPHLSAASVTRQLLAFSRKHVIEARPIDMNELIARMHKMLERLIGEDIQLRTIAGPGLGTVCVDPGLVDTRCWWLATGVMRWPWHRRANRPFISWSLTWSCR